MGIPYLVNVFHSVLSFILLDVRMKVYKIKYIYLNMQTIT